MRLRSWDPDAGPWKAWGIRAQGDYRTAEGLNQVDLVIGNPGLDGLMLHRVLSTEHLVIQLLMMALLNSSSSKWLPVKFTC
jgi:hypothetical protein